MAWTDEKKAQAVEMYEAKEPTPENTMEIVKEIAEELEESPNGVRMVLTKAEVYVKKEAAPAAKKEGGTTASKRVSKADSVAALEKAITAAGQEVDTEITSKLTGKAAIYFAGIISAIGN